MNLSPAPCEEASLLPRRKEPASTWRPGLKIWLLRALAAVGFAALLYFFSWWFSDGRLASPGLALLLLFAVLYGGVQVAGNWALYLAASQPADPRPRPPGLKVDVFVTACGEDFGLIEKSLAAACAMRGEHQTFLLDDGSDPALARLAERMGAGYLTRADRKDAKAGNLNAALTQTGGDVVAIFDVDHAPAPDFLERSLGHFTDPCMGFVQVMLTFGNYKESWVAQAAMETSLEFYNPTSLGMDGLGSATMMGSNALIRRAALESIGGYRPGLAEDLATSLALHAAGWRSAYVAEPLAPGLAPPSFTAWFVQQLKWARGVFELLLTTYPRVFFRLAWGQRLSYAVRMTKYWIGPVVGFHLLATIAVLIFSAASFRDAFHAYLMQLTPLAMCDVLIRASALSAYRHPATPRTSLVKAVTLIYATWPIYLLAWLMAIFRMPLAFRPTPKSASGKLKPVWLLPQVLALLLLTAGALYTVLVGGHRPSLLLVFAILQGALQLFLLSQWLNADVAVAQAVSKSLTALREISRPVGINRRLIKAHVRDYQLGLARSLDQLPLEALEQVATILHQARLSNRRVFILGNASSSWISSQFARGLANHRMRSRWPAFRIFEVLEKTTLRALEYREHGYEKISYEQLAELVGAGDIIIGVSCAVFSRRQANALKLASARQAKTIAIAGAKGDQVDPQVDLILQIAGESSGRIEDTLLMVVRLICKVLQEVVASRVPEQQSVQQSPKIDHQPANTATDLPGIPEFAGLAAISQGSLSSGFLYELQRTSQFRTSQLQVDQEAILRKVLQISVESLGAASGSLLLFDERGEVSQAALALAGQVESYSAGSFSETLREGLAGWVVENRQPALVASTYEDPRWLRRPWDEINGTRSAISVPLLDADRVAGVLTLVHPEPGRFTEGDVAMLVSIAVSLTLFHSGSGASLD
jgi:cellulose synthase (UDP-forming)